jgi:putative transposase
MSRIARVVAQGYPHHVTQRGNYRQAVFETDDDYLQYLQWLKEYSDKYNLDIWAYCLMNNHVHFVCVPEKEDSLSRTFNMLHMRYAQYVNRRKHASGHLWQGRFYSSILDERHTCAAVRYVENNPVRAGIVEEAEDYRWSSAREHSSGSGAGIITARFYLTEEILDWKNYLREKEDEAFIKNIRKNAITGRPCGEKSFIEKLEKMFGYRLQAVSRGRPVK